MATQETKKLIRVTGVLLAETIVAELKDMVDVSKPGHGAVHAQICAELIEGVKRGKVKRFSDLHDYMDANTLGQSEMVMGILQVDIPPEGDEAKVQLSNDVLDEAFGCVDRWIRDGGLRQEVVK